jgi:hypothetical protein
MSATGGRCVEVDLVALKVGNHPTKRVGADVPAVTQVPRAGYPDLGPTPAVLLSESETIGCGATNSRRRDWH